MAVELVLAIVANLIVFLALLALLDSVLGWMGELVGQPGWSFEVSRVERQRACGNCVGLPIDGWIPLDVIKKNSVRKLFFTP